MNDTTATFNRLRPRLQGIAYRISDPVGTRAALAAMGQKMDAVAIKGLASSGPVDAEISLLTQRNLNLAAQHKAMITLKDAMANASTSSFAGFGLAAYKTNYRGF